MSAVLARIAGDEERHAELAWRTVAWALRAGGAEVARGDRGGPLDRLREEVAAVSAPSGDEALARYGVLGEEAQRAIRRRAIAEVVIPCGEALLWRGEAYASSMRYRFRRAVSGRGLHPRRQRGFGGGIDEPHLAQAVYRSHLRRLAHAGRVALAQVEIHRHPVALGRGRLRRLHGGGDLHRGASLAAPVAHPTRLLRSHHEPLEIRLHVGIDQLEIVSGAPGWPGWP